MSVKFVAVGSQRRVRETVAATADAAGLLEQFAQARREGGVASFDGVLGVADEMGESNLLVDFGPHHLGRKPFGDPEVRPDIAEEFHDHILAAARADDEAAVLIVMEHPGPPGPLADPHAGLIRLQSGAAEQAAADLAGLTCEGRLAVVKQVNQGPLTDLEPEQIRHQPRKTL